MGGKRLNNRAFGFDLCPGAARIKKRVVYFVANVNLVSMSHVNMEILNLTKELMSEIYILTLQLSKLQVFDDVRPITKSICSVTSSLPEGHKMRRYSYEFIKYLVSTHSSGSGANHLETLFEKGALTNENLCAALKTKLEMLGSVINGFKQTAETPEPE